MKVYVLSYVRPAADAQLVGHFLGVYSSQPEAARAVERLGRRPGFKEYPRGFQIDCTELDEDFEKSIFFLSPPPPPQSSHGTTQP